MTVLHFDRSTGFIMSWGSLEPIDGQSHFPNCGIVRTEDVVEIDPIVDMVDLDALAVLLANADLIPTSDHVLIKRPVADQQSLLIERLSLSVKLAVAAELSATDQYTVPDRIVANRDAWTSYRQQLRDLSKRADVPSMVRNWPRHPTGTDVPAHLRDQLTRIDALSTIET